MWRWLKWFLIIWSVLLVVSFFTVSGEISAPQRLGATALVAAVAQLVVISGDHANKMKQNRRRRCELLIHLPQDPTVVYRIEDGKIFAGVDEMPIYEIEGDKVYPRMFQGPVFRIEKNKVHREPEMEPVFEIRADKIYHIPSGKVIYEIEAVW